MKKSINEKSPKIDEGWWEAVLSDEAENQIPYIENDPRNIQIEKTSINWERVQALFNQDDIITLNVCGYNRGGLLVEGEGIQGFVPVSHLIGVPSSASEEERQKHLIGYLEKQISLKVIECEQSQERVVFSERAALAGEGSRKQLFRTLTPGDHVSGTVTNITDFGVFVDLGGVEGLIHVSELSWGRVQHPTDIVRLNQKINAIVLQVNEKNGRVALSIKQLCENPWKTAAEKHKPGDTTSAVITAIMPFGVFARLEEGIEGLIHISSMQLPAKIKNLDSIFYPEQPVVVRILHIDCERRRLGLGLVSME